jgi:hypothetical protein
MYRHIRQSCKIANSDEGPKKQAEYAMQKDISELRNQVTELTTLLKRQLTIMQLHPTLRYTTESELPATMLPSWYENVGERSTTPPPIDTCPALAEKHTKKADS